MKYSKTSLLILLFFSLLTVTHALPVETEYLGTILHSGFADDRKWGPIPIGFDFDFFGNSYNELFVSSNGLVMFESGSNAFNNVSIPDAVKPDNFIAPFWDDLVVDATGDIMYQTIGTAPNRKFIIQFNNLTFWRSDMLLGTIQVILYEGSNSIQLQYRNIVDLVSGRASGNSATIGLENIDASEGILSSFDTAGFIFSGKAIRYTPSGASYSVEDNALYDGVLLVDPIPRPGIVKLVIPSFGSTVNDTTKFQWETASNASSYYVVISQNSDLSNPVHTSADLMALTYQYILSPNQTYYWSVYSKNSEGRVSWSEIWSFQTIAAPPLIAVPQTIYLEQGNMRTLSLLFTGGDAGSKTATVTMLPAEGALYHNNGGIPGPQITTVPTDLTDPFFNLIYSASGSTGVGVGNFDYHFTDTTGTSADATYTINVSPPGIPNFLYASKEIDRVEITFDRDMVDPTGKHNEFTIEDNGVGVASTSCSLKAGDPTTIIVYVTPNLNTANAIAVSYTRGTVLAESGGILESFDFQLAGKLAQVINFAPLVNRTYGDAGYTLSATATSGLEVTFSSSNTTVVSVAGSNASVNSAGETLIFASQAGDGTYAPVTFERHQMVNKALATVTLSDLVHEYTGLEIAATVTTVPAGLNYKVTYDGLPDLPVEVKSYNVLAEIAEDNYGGSASEVLTISDSDAPVPDLATLPDLTDECSVTAVAPTATDAYAGKIIGTTVTPFPFTTQGTNHITWSYDDGNGNITSQNQTIVIDDVTNPETLTLTDLTGECSVTATAPTTTDACAGIITGTTINPLTYDTQGIYAINWTFNDGNGNSIDVTQNVIISDITSPTASAPSDVVTCDGTVDAIGLTFVTDNCSAPVASYELSGATMGSGPGDASSEIFAPGVTMVTYTLKDDAGNSNQYELTVTYPIIEDIIVTVTNSTLSCETTGSYQWINCNDNSIIAGETENTYTPGSSGEYGVILTQGSCSDTSDCYSLTVLGNGNNKLDQDYRVYPNPAREFVTIDMAIEQSNVTIGLFDITGHMIYKEEVARFKEFNLDISGYKAGLYLIQIRSAEVNSVARIIKE